VAQATTFAKSKQVKSAAAFLKIPRHVLLYRLEKYGISAPSKKD
jgi:hypothetical protein